MKVSIITSCYNRERTIADAIRSVLGQDYPDIEYIIVDGASKDNSLVCIKDAVCQFPNREIIVVSEPDHGMYEAINKGIRRATGDIIGLVHSDDFLYDNHTVSSIVNCFKQTGADFVYGDGLFVSQEDTDHVVRKWISGKFSKGKVRMGWLPLHPTCYIRREVMRNEGLYDESYKIAADSDLLVRYLYEANLKVAYLNQYIVRMRMGGLSTDKKRRKQVWEEDVRMYRSHGFLGRPSKVMKMLWKVPQFIKAKLMKRKEIYTPQHE